MKRGLTSLLLMGSLLFAEESLDIDNDFLQSLEEVSEIATKTKLNIDDTPSFVTVLQGDKLQKLGIDNLFEALALVPGVQLTKESSGVPIVVFRGATQKGEVKLLIDGIALNNTYRGSIYHYLDFPIELIKRVEVIRGSGSVLYGSGAISGVINIITHNSSKDSKNKVYTSAASHDHFKSGALITQNLGEYKLILDGHYEKDHKEISTGPDREGLSGESDQAFNNASFGARLSDTHLSLMARTKTSKYGQSHGLRGFLDQDNNNYYNINKVFVTQLSYTDNFDENNKFTVAAGYKNYAQEVEARLASNQFANSNYKEESYFTQAQLISQAFKDNEFLLGLEYSTSQVTKNNFALNNSDNFEDFLVMGDASREISSLYFNDKYSVSSKFDLSFGLRYDHYLDEIEVTSPSFGAVYRLNDAIKFKTTFSRSFRAPSWIELKDNNNLDGEYAQTLEVGVVYQYNQSNRLRLNVYTMDIEDMIAQNDTGIYTNMESNEIFGSELEYLYTPSLHSEFKLAATYIDAKDDNHRNIVGTSHILADLSALYRFNPSLDLGLLLHYRSDTYRSVDDSRDSMDPSVLFDTTLTYTLDNMTLHFIIKDLFDAQTVYPLAENIYVNDYQDIGRKLMLKAQWEF